MSDITDNKEEFFKELSLFLNRIPGMGSLISTGVYDSQNWWVKFSIDINHPLAWNVVQELAHVVNYVSLNERLPTIFYPVSPPPYMNGGPAEFLSWIIESTDPEFNPKDLAEWLEGRLPRPVEDITLWNL